MKGPNPSQYGCEIEIAWIEELDSYADARGRPIPPLHTIEGHKDDYLLAERLLTMYPQVD